jgi:Arc/MetJ-type ribon-helix-helix transcriptional regulator
MMPIPNWYHFGMSKQIAVRLADDLVEFLDQAVHDGRGRSRADVVSQAVERERRREIAERDAAILARPRPDESDLDALAEYAAKVPMDDLA